MSLLKYFGLPVLAIAGAGLCSAAYTQCPTVGSSTGCSALVTIGPGGVATIAVDASQGPYDASEDSLVGVVNQSGVAVGSLALSGSDIFGFDGDGMCSSGFGVAGNCSQGLNMGDPYDYSGDLVTFTITDTDNGVVNFVGGLANGASTYFSLEQNLASTTVTPGPVTPAAAPEPASVALLLAGGAGLAFAGLRRKFAR